MLCGGTDSAASDTIEWREQRLHYVICGSCGLKYMSPRPTQGWYLRFYEHEFWQEKATFQGYSSKGAREAAAIDEGTAKRVAKQRRRALRIADLLAPVVSLDSASLVIDVGTAFGETPALLRERHGCRVLGVEPSAHGRAYCAEVNGVELVGRYMEDLAERQPFDGEVDLVVMSHVLENIVDPRAALASARRLLRPEGSLYLDTCNFYFNNAVNPYHPYVFSPETLTDLLARCGFGLLAQYSETHPRQASWPTDPYLAVIARPAVAATLTRPVDVERLVADQQLGLSLLAESKRRRRDYERSGEAAAGSASAGAAGRSTSQSSRGRTTPFRPPSQSPRADSDPPGS